VRPTARTKSSKRSAKTRSSTIRELQITIIEYKVELPHNSTAISGSSRGPGNEQSIEILVEETMRGLAFLAAAVIAVASLVGSASADGRYGKQKVVYHINEQGDEGGRVYGAALRNIQNHINAVGKDNIDVKVVLHGNGVGLLAAARDIDKLKVAVASLKSQNVGFNVCDNTLKGRKIDYQKDLFDVYKDDIVPSGVAEVSRLQHMGYTYIKP
jgi:uncharacterized protein